MVKSILHITVSIVLLISTIGITISRHYCGENLIHTALFLEAESCCDGSADCCHNETEYFQFKDDYVSSVVFDISDVQELDLIFMEFPVLLTLGLVEIEEEKVFIPESPPPLLTQTKLSLLQTYLI